MILQVGLTGGIASGKSAAGRLFAEFGAFVIDADVVVRELYQAGQTGHRALVAHYGNAILTPEGEIDRIKLSTLALQDDDSAAVLNGLIHPLVIDRERKQIARIAAAGTDAIVVVEATLLLESGGRSRYSRIVIIDIEPEIQVQRAVARGLDRNETLRRMARQMPREERLKLADYIISNHRDVAELRSATEGIWAALISDLASAKRSEKEKASPR